MQPDYLEIALSPNSIQFYAIITGVITVFLTARRNIWCWPVGIVSTILAAYVYLFQQLPYEALLQVFYLIMAIYGWINWYKSSENKGLVVEYTSLKQHIWLCTTAAVVGLGLGYFSFLHYHSYLSFLDALLTTFSLAANWLAAKRKIENWWYWIVIDSISVGLYHYKGMDMFALLFIFYTLLAIRGLGEWKEGFQE